MIALLAAAALATTDASGTGEAPADGANLERLYAQSCGERAYATYDDVCNTLRNQIDRYRKDEAKRLREERAHPKPVAKEPAAGPAAVSTSAQKP